MGVQDRVGKAFSVYGFTDVAAIELGGAFGAVAFGPRIGCTVRRRKAFYVEGSPREMGHLVARLAPDDVMRMAGDYVDRVALEFLHEGLGEKLLGFGKLLVWLVEGLIAVEHVQHDLPKAQLEEIAGLVDGCVDAGACARRDRRMLQRRLVTLNAGIDVLLSLIYPLKMPRILQTKFRDGLRNRTLSRDLVDGRRHKDNEDEQELAGRVSAVLERWKDLAELLTAKGVDKSRRPLVKVPLLCNFFSAFGATTRSKDAHFVGRDFTFPTANVFQDTGCFIVRNPTSGGSPRPLATLSVAAPGMVGAVTAMNTSGVIAGVDMVPAACCDPSRPGLNSLMLVREVVEHAATGQAARESVVNAQRGVSWLYPMACRDRETGRDEAWVVEAGKVDDNLDALRYTSEDVRPLLPTKSELGAATEPPARRGCVIREVNYRLAPEWNTRFNGQLFREFGVTYSPEQFMDAGTLADVPDAYYFGPQREAQDDLLIATNGYVTPLMRVTAMNAKTVLVTTRGRYVDIQRRYDTLQQRLCRAIELGGIDLERAKGALERLAQPDPKETRINGATTIAELHSRELVMHTHLGYFADDWVQLGLLPFLPGARHRLKADTSGFVGGGRRRT